MEMASEKGGQRTACVKGEKGISKTLLMFYIVLFEAKSTWKWSVITAEMGQPNADAEENIHAPMHL